MDWKALATSATIQHPLKKTLMGTWHKMGAKCGSQVWDPTPYNVEVSWHPSPRITQVEVLRRFKDLEEFLKQPCFV